MLPAFGALIRFKGRCLLPILAQDETSIHTGSTGTPGFAAPELLTDGKLTKAADIYSLGIISECCCAMPLPYGNSLFGGGG